MFSYDYDNRLVYSILNLKCYQCGPQMDQTTLYNNNFPFLGGQKIL